MSEEWFNKMRNKMEDHTEEPPEGLWDDIRKELFDDDQDKMIVPVDGIKAQKKIVPEKSFKNLFYKVSGAAAVLAFIIFGGVKFFEDYQTESVSVVTKVPETKNSAEDYLNNSIKNNISQDESFSNSKPAITDLDKSFKVSNFNEKIEKYQEEILKPFNNNLFGNQVNNDLFFPNVSIRKQDVIFPDFNHEIIFEKNHALISKKEKADKTKLAKNESKKDWMLGMMTGSTSQNATEQFPGYATLNGASMSLSDEIWTAGYQDNPLTAILLANQDKPIDAKIRHKVPVTFGLSVYRNLGKRWGVGTGINYTKLSTELRSGSESDYIKSDQSVHYIGIPVQVNYNVIKKGRFTGYVTAGGIAEKAVSADIKTKYVVNNEVKEEANEEIDKKPMQFSVNSAVGLQLKIVDKIAVYAEPGVGYHFKDNSPLNTVYKDKPFNFNVKFGLRLTID
ncbi:outer membrane beta-barrel protein [Chryseobacterium zhengzhouense]|uniref:Outer membrane beta-barrel protein n=1 Tax=Chryseobacterium zhengzhouense TaxID=1636086 RepID=A0ABW2LV78_9FLAO